MMHSMNISVCAAIKLMVWQERSPYIIIRIRDQITNYGLKIINSGVDEFRLPQYCVTFATITTYAHCSYPTIIHYHLGISRSATLVAAEICIACLLKGPTYKHYVQKAVQLLHSQRPLCIETPMQYIFVHRVVQKFLRDYVGDPQGFHADYEDWINARARRPFIDDANKPTIYYFQYDIANVCLNYRREIHDCVGQMPIPLQDTREQRFGELQLTKRYPRGNRYE
uniref:TYR_PHOSPHATASE_2 domain-containing protein n=1 Tax=Elaeophora elaphi TaxID=1147741 RepID=A0A0R3RLJ5_9BILA